MDQLLMGDLAPYPTFFYNQTQFRQYFNFLRPNPDTNEDNHVEFLQLDDTRRALHVGSNILSNGAGVEPHLYNDMLQSVKPWIEVLLEEYPILFYNGQLDIIVAYALTEEFLQTLEWSGADAYRTASRTIWEIDNDIAGYKKTAGFLTEVVVRNAGHMVPTDQPKWAFELVSNFVENARNTPAH